MRDKASDLREPYYDENIIRYDDLRTFMSRDVFTLVDTKHNIYVYDENINFSIFNAYETESKQVVSIKIYGKNNTIINTFVNKCINDYNNAKYEKDKLKYYEYLKNDSKTGQPQFVSYPLDYTKTFNSIFFPNKKHFIKKIDNFMNDVDKYKRLEIPYTLGILLYGPPGTGKTSIIKALANYTKRNICALPFNRFYTCNEFTLAFNEKIGDVVDFDSKIIVFEDADCLSDILHKRDEQNKETSKISKNIICVDKSGEIRKDHDELNLSHILNTFDGLNESYNRIIVMTSNNIDVFDNALVRPGRFDIVLNMTYMDSESIIEKINSNFNILLNSSSFAKYVLNKKITGAELHNMCMSYDDPFDVLDLLYQNISREIVF